MSATPCRPPRECSGTSRSRTFTAPRRPRWTSPRRAESRSCSSASARTHRAAEGRDAQRAHVRRLRIDYRMQGVRGVGRTSQVRARLGRGRTSRSIGPSATRGSRYPSMRRGRIQFPGDGVRRYEADSPPMYPMTPARTRPAKSLILAGSSTHSRGFGGDRDCHQNQESSPRRRSSRACSALSPRLHSAPRPVPQQPLPASPPRATSQVLRRRSRAPPRWTYTSLPAP